MPGSTADVVVIGGGISGTAAAYELARSGASVVLIERDELASMASGRTLAGVRQSGRHPAELPLARAAVRRWQSLAEELDADLEYRQEGNLRLARAPDEVPIIAGIVEQQRALGLEIAFLPDNSVVRGVASALAETVLAASFCPSDGHANPIAAVRAFGAAAARHGARIRTGTTVTAIAATGGRIGGVATSAGAVAADVVVATAGIDSARLCAPLGFDLPIRVSQVAVVQTVPRPPLIRQVLGVATGDFAGRQQVDGRFRLTGGAFPWQAPAGALGADAVQPPAAAVATAIERGVAVLPALAAAKVARVWGGLIDMTPDALPVIERSQAIAGLVVAAGFSGHGFCLGPVTGQIVRELVVDGTSSLPIAPFRSERFAGAPAGGEHAAASLHG